MLLSFLSSAAFSLLRRSFGLSMFFSLGTSAARGWRWPTGAGGGPAFLTAVELPPLWANATGAPIRVTSAIDRNILRIPALHLPILHPTARGREPRLSHNSVAPGQHNPAPFARRP